MAHTVVPFDNAFGFGPRGMSQYRTHCVYRSWDYMLCTYYTTQQTDGIVLDIKTTGSVNMHIADVIALRDELNKIITAQENTHD